MRSALVAMSSFKGSLSNVEACDAVVEGLTRATLNVQAMPIGDGGRGTGVAVQRGVGGAFTPLMSSGPLSKKVTAQVLCFPDAVKPRWIYIESADTCGYHLVAAEERDALRASSYGLGTVLHEAWQRWGTSVERVYVGLGDSAVSDAGMGMLCALGFQFFDDSGHPLWGNATGLRHVRRWTVPDDAPWLGKKVTVLCDVLNPLCGSQGSARVFSPQKGASAGQVSAIEAGMENFARLIGEAEGRDVRLEPMSGSAGGLSAALLSFLNAELVHGARFLLDWIGFDRALEKHPLVVTGEGRTDRQTLAGKAPFECVERAERMGKKAAVISGALGDGHEALARRRGVMHVVACGDQPSAADALSRKAQALFESPKVPATF